MDILFLLIVVLMIVTFIELVFLVAGGEMIKAFYLAAIASFGTALAIRHFFY